MRVTAFGCDRVDHRAPVAIPLGIGYRLGHAGEHKARPVAHLAPTDSGETGGVVEDVLLMWGKGHTFASILVAPRWAALKVA